MPFGGGGFLDALRVGEHYFSMGGASPAAYHRAAMQRQQAAAAPTPPPPKPYSRLAMAYMLGIDPSFFEDPKGEYRTQSSDGMQQ